MPAPESSSKSRIYLDHAATTPLRGEVRQAMEPYLEERFGNPSSLHGEGRAAREALEAAREAIRKDLEAEDFDLVFTGGGTDSDNAAILGVLLGQSSRRGKHPGDLHVVASAVEHSAVLGALEVASAWGVPHTLVPVDRWGRVDSQAVLEALRPETALVSVMAANNEVGTLEPIAEIGRLLKERGILFHTDAVQLLGKSLLPLGALPTDLASLSAHKIYGPKATGGLLIRRGVPFAGIPRGGPQENGRRGGTQNVAAAAGFARAVALALEELPAEAPRLQALRDQLAEVLRKALPGTVINTPLEQSVPHLLNVTFERVEGESLLLLLDHLGVAVSTGSACNTGAKKPSHVLKAMGRNPAEIRGSIRFSLGRSTTAVGIETAAACVEQAVQQLRRLAP
ncbi:MAG: cysteine desulfurase [Planctomycetes bacterium]|nr:cysteine desulfurase [Planctomycetota bacterium]